MAYDPNLPVNNAPVVSAELRAQFAGLKALMDLRPTTTELEVILANETGGSCEAIASLALTISNPPTSAEVQAIADKVDELIDALRRV